VQKDLILRAKGCPTVRKGRGATLLLTSSSVVIAMEYVGPIYLVLIKPNLDGPQTVPRLCNLPFEIPIVERLQVNEKDGKGPGTFAEHR